MFEVSSLTGRALPVRTNALFAVRAEEPRRAPRLVSNTQSGFDIDLAALEDAGRRFRHHQPD